MSLVARVRRTVHERRLFGPGARVLVACSGGPDSVALVHVLATLADALEVGLAVASVDHGLRPEAAAEVAGVGRLAAALDLPFHPLRVGVAGAGSLQARARAARYAALLACAREVGASHVAVGHTRDDQAETVLARLLRGAGVAGLRGILPARGDGVVRPLIDCRRVEIERHVDRHGLPVVRDPSNDDRRFLRVRLRRDLAPRLAAEDPRWVEHFAALADEARDHAADARRRGRRLLRRAAGAPGGVDAATLAAASAAVRRAALGIFVRRACGSAPSRAQLEALDRAVLRGQGEVRLAAGWRARLSPGGGLALAHEPGFRGRGRSRLPGCGGGPR